MIVSSVTGRDDEGAGPHAQGCDRLVGGSQDRPLLMMMAGISGQNGGSSQADSADVRGSAAAGERQVCHHEQVQDVVAVHEDDRPSLRGVELVAEPGACLFGDLPARDDEGVVDQDAFADFGGRRSPGFDVIRRV